MRGIDERVDALLAETNRSIDADNSVSAVGGPLEERLAATDPFAEQPATVNPRADSLIFTPDSTEADEIIARLQGYGVIPDDATHLDLPGALRYAIEHSREFRFAEEEYVLTALRLLIERHRWGPRFFDDVSATVAGDGDEGLFDTSLRLVNEFRVTQRLPYGGEVSARALARATEDLHQRVSGEPSQSADLVFSADIPLLRGAGETARESRIQAERNLVYSAREFERYRREFLVDITVDFLDLVVSQRNIVNAERNVASFRKLQDRGMALYEAGRQTRFEAARAEQDTVEAIERLTRTQESYRLAVDRFKVRLGMTVDQALVIDPSDLPVPTPLVAPADAVQRAFSNRLDLQTERDQLDDARRAVANAENELLPDLDLSGSLTVPTDSDKERAGLDFMPGDSSFNIGITYGLPLDREIERLSLRQSQISMERALRSVDRYLDDIAVEVRSAVRGIDRALFSLQIQERNIEIAQQRKASIEADPDRATIQDQSDAINGLLSAEDNRESADRDVKVAVLRYLLSSGQLRVNEDGTLRPPQGMIVGSSEINREEDSSSQDG